MRYFVANYIAKPFGTKYDGCISIRNNHKRKHYYKYIRISESNWVPLHRYIWEKANGKIPKDKVLIFINGDQMDCRLENLKLISKAENAIRNAGDHLKDGQIAGFIAGRNKELKEEILRNHPELIKLKREQLKLGRKINEVSGCIMPKHLK